MTGPRHAASPGLATTVLVSSLAVLLLLLAMLHYLLGARSEAVQAAVWQCADSRECERAYLERLARDLSDTVLLPASLDTRTAYAQGVLDDYVALDERTPRQAREKYREQAIGHYREAVWLRPLWSPNWLALGNDYMLLGRFADAQQAFSRLLEIDPFPPFHFDLLSQALNYSVLWDEAFRKRLLKNLRSYLEASEWGGRHIRMAVELGYGDAIRDVLHNDWQRAVLMHAEQRRDERVH